MSNETKQEVFNDLVEELADAYIALDGEGIGEELTNEDKQAYLKDYDTALPDDMPVIPKAVGKYIQEHKAAGDSLALTLTACILPNEVFEWMLTVTGDPDTELSQIEYVKQQDTFARAWVLGVWSVEETGEFVKVEAQHE